MVAKESENNPITPNTNNVATHILKPFFISYLLPRRLVPQPDRSLQLGKGHAHLRQSDSRDHRVY